MKILIFGANGFVGQAVCKELSKDHQVYSAGRELETDVSKLSLRVDLTNRKSIDDAVELVSPDVVINCAGIVDANQNVDLNVVFTTNILQAIAAWGKTPRRIIILGSAGEYGAVKAEDFPVKEDAPLNATSPYGVSKRNEVATALQLANSLNLPVTIARLFNPLGAGMPPRMLPPRLLGQMREIASGKRDAIEIGRLDAVRDYVDLRDVALAIRAIVEGEPKHSIYNIGSGRKASNGELLDLLLNNSKILSSTPRIIETSTEPEPSVASQADISRLVSDFGWHPMYTLEETVREILHDTDN